MARARIHPVLIGGGIIALLAVLSVLLVSFVSMRERSSYEICKIRLKQIDIAVKGGALPSDAAWEKAGRGRAFLVDRHLWPTAQDRPLDLRCPVLGTSGPQGVDYRGPALAINRLGNQDPLCADRTGNHGPGRGGNVLMKNGSIYALEESHPLWARAAETTSD